MFFLVIAYKDEIPYPLILETPKLDETIIADQWKNLIYPCFKVETLSGNLLSDYSGYFSISRTRFIKSFFLHSINLFTEAFGINLNLIYFVEV